MMGSLDMIFGIGVRSLLPGDDELLPFYNRHLLQSRLAKSPVVRVLYSLIVFFFLAVPFARHEEEATTIAILYCLIGISPRYSL